MSDTTIRRRIKAGDLTHRTSEDGRIEVRVPASLLPKLPEAGVATTPTATTPTATTPTANTPKATASAATPQAGAAAPLASGIPDPADLNQQLTRFQQMAGASVVLAQNQTDEANEKLALVRYELDRARSIARWSIGLAAFSLLVTFWSLWSGGSNSDTDQASHQNPRPITQTARVD